MTKDEAMQLALDALETAVQVDQLQGGEWDDMAHTAIAALRAALERLEKPHD